MWVFVALGELLLKFQSLADYCPYVLNQKNVIFFIAQITQYLEIK